MENIAIEDLEEYYNRKNKNIIAKQWADIDKIKAKKNKEDDLKLRQFLDDMENRDNPEYDKAMQNDEAMRYLKEKAQRGRITDYQKSGGFMSPRYKKYREAKSGIYDI